MSYTPLQCQTLFATGIAVPLTGTTSKTTLFGGTIKGGTMGPNDWLRFDGVWSNNNSANIKTASIQVNASVIFAANYTTTLSVERMVYFINRNSLSSQVATNTSTQGQYGTIGISTYAINTAIDFSVTWSGDLTDVGDTQTLERASCEIWRSAQ